MRALIFEGPAADTTTTRVAELPLPQPGPGQVSIDVRYAGVNFKDVMARRGDAGYVDEWPFVPGLEVAGAVRAVGAGVSGVMVGEAVAAFTGVGGLAEVAIADAALTVSVPSGLDLAQAAAAPGALATADLLLNDVGRLRAGETVLLHGAAGGVGQAVVRLARLNGAARVLGTVGSADRAEAARRLGYDQVYARDERFGAAISEATEGRGVDLILDPQGTKLVDPDLEMAAPAARIVLFGNATGAPFAPLPALDQLLARNVSLAGFSLAALARKEPARVAAALSRVLDHLAAGALTYELTTIAGLHGAPAAQQAVADGRVTVKQVVEVAAD